MDDSATTKIDKMKADLLRMRRAIITASGVEEVADDEGPPTMTRRQRNYLIALLKEETISEEDAELVLRLMQPHADEVIDHLQTRIGTFPNLAKEIHRFCAGVTDKNKTKVAEIVLSTYGRLSTPRNSCSFGWGSSSRTPC